jgi:hypothetical protein
MRLMNSRPGVSGSFTQYWLLPHLVRRRDPNRRTIWQRFDAEQLGSPAGSFSFRELASNEIVRLSQPPTFTLALPIRH